MILYGKNCLKEAIKNKSLFEKILVSDNELISELKTLKIKHQVVEKKVLDKIVKDNQGVIAYVEDYKYYSIAEINKKDLFILILDKVQDQQNLGAIIRTAVCAGVDYCILPKHESVKIDGVTSKTSAGAIQYVKCIQVSNINNALDRLKKLGYWVYGAEYLDKSVDYTSIKYDKSVCLVIGSEGKGISRLTLEKCDFYVKIPMKENVNSLNASVSAGIIIYEILKQRS